MAGQPHQNYKYISAAALERRESALPREYLLSDDALKDLPEGLTLIPEISTHFTIREREILNAEAETILEKIRDRAWTALSVTGAFCKSASVANQLTNCLTEILFPEALSRAAYLDEYQAKNDGAVIGPLHGLPISLKDQFPTPPHPSSLGIALLATFPANSEMPFLTMLRDMGAVFYVKTNVPTALMMMETKNNVYGESLNPFNTNLSPGGSSGGEGALIAMKGSPLGIGTETGGSARHPAAWTHLYAMKPSTGRLPIWGLSDRPFSSVVLATSVPMARSLGNIRTFYRALLSPKVAPWLSDPSCLPIPWREEDAIQPDGRKFRFGIMGIDDGLVTVHPPVERALQMARLALERAGHEVVDWETPEHPELWQNLINSFVDLNLGTISHLLDLTSEPRFPSMEPYFAKAGADSNPAILEDCLSPTAAKEIVHRRTQLQQAYMKRWNETSSSSRSGAVMDGIITPASAWAGCKRGTVDKVEYFGFGGVFNVLDLPVCTFPVTFANKDMDLRRTNFQPLNDLDKAIQESYDPIVSHGGPVGLQMVGRRLEEEKVLGMTELVSRLLQDL